MLSYKEMGEDPKKVQVKSAVADHVSGRLFPASFSPAVPDIFTNDDDYCLITHSDGCGTKPILAYLAWKETGDVSWFKGLAQDAIAMNANDMACVGAVGPYLISNTISRHYHKIPGEVIAAIIEGYAETVQTLNDNGIHSQLAGGETASVGDIVRTLTIEAVVSARLKRSDFIDISARVNPGNVIIGIASDGQASWESTPNSGVACNGMTLMRHGLLSGYYKDNFPEIFTEEVADKAYAGPFRMGDTPDILGGIDLAAALLAPTRLLSPLVVRILKAIDKDKIAGFIHNTGGGWSKINDFLPDGAHVVRDNPLPLPPFYHLLKQTIPLSDSEFQTSFNSGCLLEVYCDASAADDILAITVETGINAQVIGYVAG